MHKDKAVGCSEENKATSTGILKNGDRKLGNGLKMLKNLGLVSNDRYGGKEKNYSSLLGHSPVASIFILVLFRPFPQNVMDMHAFNFISKYSFLQQERIVCRHKNIQFSYKFQSRPWNLEFTFPIMKVEQKKKSSFFSSVVGNVNITIIRLWFWLNITTIVAMLSTYLCVKPVLGSLVQNPT